MKEIKVSTQQEYDQHKNDKNVVIVIEAGSITIGDSASVYARGSARFYARGSASVYAYGSASVYAYGSARVYAYDSASVDARGSASVDAYDSARVYAYDSARVYAYDSARVDAYDSARVDARGSARVYAYDSARVDAYDSARVYAYGSASVYAYGLGAIDATTYAVIIKMRWCRSPITGGHVVEQPDLSSESATIEMWSGYYGTKVDDGKMLVYKGVSPQLVSDHGTEYPIGGEASAPDWQPTRECGNGLHFSPTPRHTNSYHSFGDDARYLLCEVDAGQAVIIDDKIKAPSCRVLHEVDIHGNKIEQKEEVTA